MPSISRSATLTIDQLEISPHNARTNRADSAPTEAFARTICAFGLIHPLRVHPMLGRKGKWGVHAGARRYRTIRQLIADGRLPADWPVDVSIREGATDSELLQESEVENNSRTDLRPYEMFQGVARAHRRGATIEQIALNMGQDEVEMRRWLRLGNLAKPIFEALEAGVLSVDQAKAYGATEDHTLQFAAFETVSAMADSARTPSAIRKALGIGDAELQRFLRVVGADVYEAAGGGFERDLFTGDDVRDARVIDVAILRELVDARIAATREQLRERTGRPDLRFSAAPPQNEYGDDWTLTIQPTATASDGLSLPDGEVVACVKIGRDGEIEHAFWWASRKAKAEAERGDAAPARAAARTAPRDGAGLEDRPWYADRRGADAAIREDEGLSQDGVQIFCSLRRTILRGRLVDQAQAQGAYELASPALDWLVWSQLRLMLTETRISQLGSGYISNQSSDPDVAREHVRATEAWHRWSHALYELQQQTFLTDTDLADAFCDYRASSVRLKQLAIAAVAGLALERSTGTGIHRTPAHDALAAELGLDDDAVRALWTPTAALLDLLPKRDRLAIAEPLVERASFAPWSRLKKAELTKAVLEVVTGASNVVRASMADAAARWVHPLLRFDPGPDDDDCPPVNDDGQLDIEDAVREVAA